MDDIQINTDAMGTETAGAPKPVSTPPKHESPIEQTKDMAKKVLAMITGRAKS